MSDVPGRSYFLGISQKTGFKLDSLEKAYRLMEILGRIRQVTELSDRLALKGGTAIQGLMFGFRRLSVDIDLNYIGSVEKVQMEKDRIEIRKTLNLLFKDMGYEVRQPPIAYAEEQFYLHFTNSGGGLDRLKFEINYLERLPVIGTEVRIINSPFQDLGKLEIRSYRPEELYAGKMRALIVRGTPRDLYDAYLMADKDQSFDWDLWRKITIFYLAMQSADVRKLDAGSIETLNESDIENQLIPLLSNKENVDLNLMKEEVVPIVKKLLKFSKGEMDYLNRFYTNHKSEQSLLFNGLNVAERLENHPSILWRLQKLDEAEKEK